MKCLIVKGFSNLKSYKCTKYKEDIIEIRKFKESYYFINKNLNKVTDIFKYKNNTIISNLIFDDVKIIYDDVINGKTDFTYTNIVTNHHPPIFTNLSDIIKFKYPSSEIEFLDLDNYPNYENVINLIIDNNKFDYIFYSFPDFDIQQIKDINLLILDTLSQNSPVLIGGYGASKILDIKLKPNQFLIIGNDLNKLKLLPQNQELGFKYVYKIHNSNNLIIKKDYIYSYKEILKNFNINIPVSDNKIGIFIHSIMVNYGCNNVCAFCDFSKLVQPNYKEKYNNLSVIYKYYQEGYNTCCLFDCNLLHSNRLDILQKYLNSKNIKMNFIGGVSLLQLNENKVKQLHEIGLKIANIGIETLEHHVQKRINKIIPINEIEEKLEMLTSYNIGCNLSFITCLPGSTLNEIQLIKDFYYRNSNNIGSIKVYPLFIAGDIKKNPKKYNVQNFCGFCCDLEQGISMIQQRKQQYLNTINLSQSDFKVYKITEEASLLYLVLINEFGAKKANQLFYKYKCGLL